MDAANVRKKDRAAQIRELIQGEYLVSMINHIMLCLMVGLRPNYARRPMQGESLQDYTQGTSYDWTEMTKDDVERYHKLLTNQFKLLAKVLPDLKAMEINDVTERRQLSDIELGTRILGVLNARGEVRTH